MIGIPLSRAGILYRPISIYNRRKNPDTGIFYTPRLLELHREGHRLKHIYWESTLASVGEGVVFWDGLKVMGPSNVRIGASAVIASNVTLDGRGGLSIGSWTLVGFDTVILSSTHRHEDFEVPIQMQGMDGEPVTIGRNVWIGARAMILPGARIGDGAIIGAMSLVRGTIPPATIAAGVPAKVIRERESSQFHPRSPLSSLEESPETIHARSR